MTTNSIRPLDPAALCRRFDVTQLEFETTASVEEVPLLFGQARAVDAMRLAVGMEREGYNVFVMGPPGVGKRTLAMQFMAERCAASAPSDWVYVNNFQEPTKPWALQLPAAEGPRLKSDVAQVVEELRSAIPAVFESDEYRSRASQLDAEFSERHDKAFAALAEEAASRGVGVLHTPAGFSIAPMKDGEVMNPDDFQRLPKEDQERMQSASVELQGKLERIVRQMIDWRRDWRNRLKLLNREMTLFAVGHLMQDLKQRYASLPRIVLYLEALEHDVVENADDFRRAAPGASPAGDESTPVREPTFRRYAVNVLVSNGETKAAPVVVADHPTHQNLIGRVDHLPQFGTLVTDFGLIKPGALHRANGGCLLIDAHKLLMQPFAWEALKRALLSREIRIESLAESYSLISTISLAPEPIALDVKVALLGDPDAVLPAVPVRS
ncbi:MAG: AAA family ATPase [Burkholderiales bacterium]